MKHFLRILSLACLATLAFSCSGSSGGSSTPDGDGRLQSEAASNESPSEAQALGKLSPGGTLRVRGTVSAFGADQFDTFRFEASSATTVDLTLALDGGSADVDVWLGDGAGAIRERFETASSTGESGSFDLAAGEVALLAVTAADVDADYELTLEGR